MKKQLLNDEKGRLNLENSRQTKFREFENNHWKILAKTTGGSTSFEIKPIVGNYPGVLNDDDILGEIYTSDAIHNKPNNPTLQDRATVNIPFN